MSDRPKVITLQNLERFKEDYDRQVAAEYCTKEEAHVLDSKIENAASGSPKGVYSTLAALQAAYPTGTSGIYVVTADGHWYYWNGTAWTDGGTYLTSLPDYALDESSSNSIQNGIVTKSFNNIVKSFQNINSYLYKKDTYINASNEETYIDGYDLYKIPVKDFEVILLTWDANDPFYDSGFNVAYLFDIEDANGDITSLEGSYGYSTHGFYPDNGIAIFFADNLLGAKYLYVCVKRLKASTLNLKIANTNQVITNDYETDKIKTIEYNNNDNFINTPAFINNSNLSSILAGGSYAAYIKMKQGDKLIFEGNLVDLSYNGAYRDISGLTIISLGTASEFVAPSDIIAFVFLQLGGTRKITYIPEYTETLVKNTTERALKENSLYPVSNNLTIKGLKNAILDFTDINLYLYKENCYLNASNEETYLSGYNLYKIPLKLLNSVSIKWDAYNPFYDGGFNTNYLFKIKNSDNSFSVIQDENYYARTYWSYAIAQLYLIPSAYHKELYICAKADKVNTINLSINYDYTVLNTKYDKTIKVLSYQNYDGFIESYIYPRQSDGYFTYTTGLDTVKIPMEIGDKIELIGQTSASFTYVIIDEDGVTTHYSNFNFTATKKCVAFVFFENGSTNKVVYTPNQTIYVDANNLLNKEQAESNFNGLTGVAFGTSLTYRSQTTGGYLTKLAELSGINFDNQGIGSSTILGNMLAAIKNYNAYSGKRVALLEGFVNDWWYNHDKLGTWKDTGETTVCGCVRSAINYIYSQNANITLFLILDHYGKQTNDFSNASTVENPSGLTQFEFYEEIAKVAESLGVVVIKQYALSEISENTPQYLLDNIHCNALGAVRSAYAIWSVMKNFYPNNI